MSTQCVQRSHSSYKDVLPLGSNEAERTSPPRAQNDYLSLLALLLDEDLSPCSALSFRAANIRPAAHPQPYLGLALYSNVNKLLTTISHFLHP